MSVPSWDRVAARYELGETTVEFGGRTLTLTHPRDVNALVDAMSAEDFGEDERLPYWSALWASARVLADWLVATPPLPSGTALELGAGLGLPSLAASLRGDRVIATDYEPDALAFAARNAAQNGLSLEVEALDYRAWPERHRRAHASILGSDLLYEARAVEPLAASIDFALAEGGEAIVADPGRPHLRRFIEVLAGRGLQVEALAVRDTTLVRARRTPSIP